jgi:transcriptional regulator with XRE-family HTH domain
VLIGEKLREIREGKNLSQGDIEQRTGLFRGYISRVENGYTVPSVETLETFARALEVPLYELFYDGKSPIQKPTVAISNHNALRGAIRKDWGELQLFAEAFSRMNERNRKLLFAVASAMANRSVKPRE